MSAPASLPEAAGHKFVELAGQAWMLLLTAVAVAGTLVVIAIAVYWLVCLGMLIIEKLGE